MGIVQRILRLIPLSGLLMAVVACGTPGAQSAPASVGQPAPVLELPALNGDTVRLAEHNGHVVIVNFWASWCPPCVNETPRLVDWSKKYQAEGLDVIGVAQVFRDSRDKVAEFAQKNAVTYPVPLDATGDLSNRWQVGQFLPRSYVIDREGVVRFIKLGEITDRDFEEQVRPLLEAHGS